MPKTRDILPLESYVPLNLWKGSPVQLISVIELVFFKAGFKRAKFSNPFPRRDVSLENQIKHDSLISQVFLTFKSSKMDLMGYIYVCLDGTSTFPEFGFYRDSPDIRVAWIEIKINKEIKYLKGTGHESMPGPDSFVPSLWHAFAYISMQLQRLQTSNSK